MERRRRRRRARRAPRPRRSDDLRRGWRARAVLERAGAGDDRLAEQRPGVDRHPSGAPRAGRRPRRPARPRPRPARAAARPPAAAPAPPRRCARGQRRPRLRRARALRAAALGRPDPARHDRRARLHPALLPRRDGGGPLHHPGGRAAGPGRGVAQPAADRPHRRRGHAGVDRGADPRPGAAQRVARGVRTPRRPSPRPAPGRDQPRRHPQAAGDPAAAAHSARPAALRTERSGRCRMGPAGRAAHAVVRAPAQPRLPRRLRRRGDPPRRPRPHGRPAPPARRPRPRRRARARAGHRHAARGGRGEQPARQPPLRRLSRADRGGDRRADARGERGPGGRAESGRRTLRARRR